MEDKYENVLTLITYYQMVREGREGEAGEGSDSHVTDSNYENVGVHSTGHFPKHSFKVV
jgi:hypothetical protein